MPTIKSKPAAIDDTAFANEDAAANIAVLANDIPTGTPKVLYSLAQNGIGVVTKGTSKLGAAISMNPDGTVNYDPTNDSTIQALAQGETATDTFIYTMKQANHLFTATVTVNLVGVNDPTTITGTVANQSTTNFDPIKPFSTVVISDVDHGAMENLFVTLLDANGKASDANGTLSGGGIVHAKDAGTYTFGKAVTPAEITSALNSVVFTPTVNQPGQTVATTFGLSAFDGFTTTNNLTTSVVTTETKIVDYNLLIVDVRSPIVSETIPLDINDSGEVVGQYIINETSTGTGGQSFGFTDIGGIINAVAIPGSLNTVVKGVNNSGDLIGYWDTSSKSPAHGFVEHNGIITNIGSSADTVVPMDINDAGTVIYVATDPSTNQDSFIRDAFGNTTAMSDVYHASVVANAINDSGEVVGTYHDPITLAQFGFIYDNGTFTDVLHGNKNVVVSAINDKGDIAGTFVDAQSKQLTGFLQTHGGQLTLLPDFLSITGISNDDVVVGRGSSHMLVYANGTEIDASPNQTTISTASAINNHNEIAGSFSTTEFGLNFHGFEGTPITVPV